MAVEAVTGTKVDPMLPLSSLKVFLSHPDPWVREAAVSPFFDACSRDPEIAKVILANVERWGWQSELRHLDSLERLALDEESVRRILELSHSAESELADALEACLLNIPLEVAPAILEQPDLCAMMADGVRETLEFRIRDARRSGKEIWKDLQKICRILDRDALAEDEEGDLLDEFAVCVEALAAHTYPSSEDLCRKIHRDDIDDLSLLEAVVSILGRRRHAPAVPYLADLLLELSEEEDAITLAIYDALGRIGDPATARLLYDRRPAEPREQSSWCLDISGASQRIYDPGSLTVLRQLLTEEQDVSVRTDILSTMLRMCDLDAFEQVLEVARAGSYDPQWIELRHDLLPYAQILGVEFPEAGSWTEDREREDARQLAELEVLEAETDQLAAPKGSS